MSPSNPSEPEYHSLFFKVFLQAVRTKKERLIISVVLTQNMVAHLAEVYKQRTNHVLYDLDFSRQMIFPYCHSIVNILEILGGLEGFASLEK